MCLRNKEHEGGFIWLLSRFIILIFYCFTEFTSNYMFIALVILMGSKSCHVKQQTQLSRCPCSPPVVQYISLIKAGVSNISHTVLTVVLHNTHYSLFIDKLCCHRNTFSTGAHYQQILLTSFPLRQSGSDFATNNIQTSGERNTKLTE